MQRSHEGFKYEPVVFPCPHVGASPDGSIECKWCGRGSLEVI